MAIPFHRAVLIVGAMLFHLHGEFSDAQKIDWTEVHNLTIRGIDRLYNLDVDEARETFDSVKAMAPADPRGYFFGSMVRFWVFTLTRDEKHYEEFLKESEKVIEVCEKILDVNDKEAVARFYLGGIYGYRGLAHRFSGSNLKAVADGRKGYVELGEAVEQKPDLYDAQMGFGLFNYLVGKVPKSLTWILSLLGFSGDVEGGLRMLAAAAEKGTYTRAEAGFFLAQFLFGEQRRDEAFVYIKRLIEKYPDNSLFLLTLANWELRTDNPDGALAAAQKALEINRRKNLRYGDEFVFSTLGSIYFARNDFGNCRENYELFLTRVQSKEYVSNWTYYRLGVAQEITGDRPRAIDTWRKMRKVTEADRARETFYYRLGHERIRTPMTAADSLIIRGDNEYGRKRYASAEGLYAESLNKNNGDPDLIARALYGLQQILFDTERYPESVAAGGRLVALAPAHESWLVPHAYFRLGMTHARSGNVEEARKAFEKVSEFDEYDFQSGLEDRAKEQLAKLKDTHR